MGQAPAQSPGYYAARMAVIVLSVLIVVALAALVVGLIRRSGAAADTPAPATQAEYTLPRNAEIVTMQTQPQRVILHLETPQGAEIVILDSGTGRLVRRIRTTP